MKSFINILAPVAIVALYILSASLYTQGYLVASYSLVLTSIVSLIIWIKSNDFLNNAKKA
jgi:hypothetical protein